MSSVPEHVEFLFFDGTRLMGEGDAAGAEAAFRQALLLAPEFSEAHANLALVLDRRGCWREAETFYRTALQLSPGQVRSHLNFGAMLATQKRFAEAEALYRHALVLDPESQGALSNLGVLLACLKREDEAEQCYRQALTINPGYRNASFNLSYLLLRQGRFEEGWACLESREWRLRLETELTFPCWRGEALQGRALLIAFEAGHGDMIHFCRYAMLAKQSGASRVSILCHPGLKNLFATLRGVDDVLAFDEPMPDQGWDFWTLPMSMPFRFNTRIDTIPAELPYLSAEPERIRHWGTLLGSHEQEFRVGMVWKGNPRFENDADRSLPSLEVLAPLGEFAQVRYFSLQKGDGEHEADSPPVGLRLENLGSRIGDFADTAAVMMNLDLVIAVDTAAVHLAGALGKPCWVLLPYFKTDWRWLSDREDSPWYPETMRLFRQHRSGDWDAVIAEVKSALHALLISRETRVTSS